MLQGETESYDEQAGDHQIKRGRLGSRIKQERSQGRKQETERNAVLVADLVEQVSAGSTGNEKINQRANGISDIEGHRYQLALRLRQVQLFLENRN